MSFIDIFILSFIEGFTEFLPISSTGHLIISSYLLNIQSPFTTQFNVIIQFGAILAVLALYWKKFLPINYNFYLKIIVGFLPSALIGLLLKDHIDSILNSVTLVAWALLVGGFILIAIDKKINTPVTETSNSTSFFNKNLNKLHVNDLNLKMCLIIGLFQCLAFIPGVSRSAATIIGGLLVGMNKKHATEFSFFLALPTLAGATLIKTIKLFPTINHSQILSLTIGLSLSFAFALLAIRSFVALVSSKDKIFSWFGIYRILLGGLILLFL